MNKQTPTQQDLEAAVNQLTKKFANIIKLMSNKDIKRKVKKEAKDAVEQEIMDKVVRGVENIAYKPKIKITDKDTEAPTYEVEFLRDYRNINEAWEAGEKKLIRMTATHMKDKPSIKLSLGCRFQVAKGRIDADNEDPDTVEMVEVETAQKRFKVKNVQIYNIESVRPTIKNLKSEMERGFIRQ